VLSEFEQASRYVPVVVSSGLPAEELAERFAGRRVAGFLQKPYRLQELCTALLGALT
jgi:hypothetical protein